MSTLELLATVALIVFLCWGATDIIWKLHCIADMRERNRILRQGRRVYIDEEE